MELEGGFNVYITLENSSFRQASQESTIPILRIRNGNLNPSYKNDHDFSELRAPNEKPTGAFAETMTRGPRLPGKGTDGASPDKN